MTASKAKREGRVPFMGTWVTPRGVEIYSMLADGVSYREICERTGVCMGSLSGYAKRARNFGILKHKIRSRVICATSQMNGSHGEQFRFRGVAEVEAAGFGYKEAWLACKQERTWYGYAWHFESPS